MRIAWAVWFRFRTKAAWKALSGLDRHTAISTTETTTTMGSISSVKGALSALVVTEAAARRSCGEQNDGNLGASAYAAVRRTTRDATNSMAQRSHAATSLIPPRLACV